MIWFSFIKRFSENILTIELGQLNEASKQAEKRNEYEKTASWEYFVQFI